MAFLIRPDRTAVPVSAARAAREGGGLAAASGRLVTLGRPRGVALGPAILLILAGLGAAAAFAPSWDSFTLHSAAGQTQTITLGNAFADPGPVIAGNVIVMVALAAVVIVAALWRPVRHGAVLLAGAIIPMAAQAISAVIQTGRGPRRPSSGSRPRRPPSSG